VTTRPAPDALQKLRDTVREATESRDDGGQEVRSDTTVTLTAEEANLVRSALAERWHDQAKYTAAEVSDTLGGGHAASLQDAAWKVREMSTVVDVFEKLGWPGERTI
jgi:hypothetical protein